VLLIVLQALISRTEHYSSIYHYMTMRYFNRNGSTFYFCHSVFRGSIWWWLIICYIHAILIATLPIVMFAWQFWSCSFILGANYGGRSHPSQLNWYPYWCSGLIFWYYSNKPCSAGEDVMKLIGFLLCFDNMPSFSILCSLVALMILINQRIRESVLFLVAFCCIIL